MRAKLSRGAMWGPFTQLLSSTYTFLFMTPGVPKVVLRPLSMEKVWQRFVGLMNETSPRNVALGPTFRADFFDGMRIYRANILQRVLNPRERRTEVPVQLIIARRDVAVRPAGYADTRQWGAATVAARGRRRPLAAVLASGTIGHGHNRTRRIDRRRSAGAGLRRAEVGRERRPFGDNLVVITGGGSGIGRETALEFARRGAEIVLSDLDLEAAKQTAELVTAAGGVAHTYELDVSDETAVAEHAAIVLAAHGVPDILINNAGIGQAGDFFATSAAEFDRVMRVNLGGVVNGCRTFGAAMAERGLGGHIVNLSSMAAYTPQRGFSAYSTSKSAVFMFSDCLRAELAGKGIEVHTICPGIVHTNIVAATRFSGLSAEEEADRQTRYDDLYRMRGYGPEKVAAQIVQAVERGRAVVPVTPEAHLRYHFHRFAPALDRFLAARVKLT
ncbi:SDR family oxidoreductase [Nocardia sp. BMG51109]|uniref:SDR family oxidoreductase n=1 Tax=Nocardia sp. BMG51109 TaxID=1056816 RepID=UPI0004B7534A|nr:SDR family oxidoreductase [Nocardia sp. BMG51109]